MCKLAHGLRAKRQNGIVELVRAGLQRKEYTVHLEPKIMSEGTFDIPDIVA